MGHPVILLKLLNCILNYSIYPSAWKNDILLMYFIDTNDCQFLVLTSCLTVLSGLMPNFLVNFGCQIVWQRGISCLKRLLLSVHMRRSRLAALGDLGRYPYINYSQCICRHIWRQFCSKIFRNEWFFMFFRPYTSPTGCK